MAQGPNWMKKTQLLTNPQEDQEVEQQELEPTNQTRLQQLQTILKNNKKHNKDLQQLRKEYELINYGNHITQFYPEFITENDYQQDIQKNVIEDEELSKLLEAFENENRNLKLQLKGWMQEFGKKTNLAELLIKQNIMIKQQLNQKNKDLVKLIQTIGLSYGDEILAYEHKLHDLTEQNNVLLQHLEKVQNSLREKKINRDQHKKLIQEKKLQRSQMVNKLNNLMENEEHFGKLYVIVQNSLENFNKQVQKLERQHTRLTKINIQLEKDKNDLSDHLDNYSQQVGQLKMTIVKQNQQKSEEYKNLNKQLKSINDQINQKTNKSNLMEEEINKCERNLIQYQNISKNISQKIVQFQPKLQSLEESLKNQLNKQAQKVNQVTMVKYEISLLQNRMAYLSEQKKKEQVQFPEVIKKVVQQKQNQRKKLQRSIQQLESRQSMNIITKNNEVNKERANLEQIQRRIQQKQQRIKAIKQQIIQFKKNKSQLSKLKKILEQRNQELDVLRVQVE